MGTLLRLFSTFEDIGLPFPVGVGRLFSAAGAWGEPTLVAFSVFGEGETPCKGPAAGLLLFSTVVTGGCWRCGGVLFDCSVVCGVAMVGFKGGGIFQNGGLEGGGPPSSTDDLLLGFPGVAPAAHSPQVESPCCWPPSSGVITAAALEASAAAASAFFCAKWASRSLSTASCWAGKINGQISPK